MAEHIRLPQFVASVSSRSTSAESLPLQPRRRSSSRDVLEAMATDESREPLLGASDSPGQAGPASSRGSDDYGTSGSKNPATPTVRDTDSDEDDDAASADAAQEGVQQADAINLVWSRSALIAAYFFIFLCSFAQALQWQIIANLTPYVTSEFASHSLIPTIELISSILSGVLKLPISKVIDVWGRPQGLAAMIVLATTGLVLMAACQDVTTYATAQVFYMIGISGFSYVLTIIIADTSSLRDRTLAFAFSNAPSLITTFIGPPISRAFLEKSSWRWGFALSAILFFFLSIPILLILTLNARKAARLGLLKKHKQNTEKWSLRVMKRHSEEYDLIGIILSTAGLTMVFVPFSMGTSGAGSTNVIALVIGLLLLAAFGFHERYYAKYPVIAFSLLFSRNVAGSCLISVLLFLSYNSWDSYYSSYLQVVHNMTITEAGYIDHIYAFGSTIWGVVVGYLIRKSDRYKWLAWMGLPFHILGGASMIVFRRPDTQVGFLVMCQILITIGGSTLVICDQMAVMAASTHAELASVMAVVSLASYVGSAGGNALSGSIWNSTLPQALAELLPDFSKDQLKKLRSDLKEQLSYPMGSPTRTAIIAAYDRAQVRMCVTGALISLVQIVAVAMWRDARMSQVKQVKGKVI